jgi:hypothetical protein
MPPETRLATHMLVNSLVRRTAQQGDFATVLHKGDPTAGALLLVARERGQNPKALEQFPAPDGTRQWERTPSQNIENEEQLSDYLARRVVRDPDIWILELDVAFAERLTGLLATEA